MLKDTRKIKINENIAIGGEAKLLIIAGPCVIENIDMLHKTCSFLKAETEKKGFSYVFKTSYDKANRTSKGSYRGPGLTSGLKMIEEIKRTYKVPVLIDVHERDQVAKVAAIADIIQIPAFLCRQTDFITEAAQSGKCVNIKKGQFVAPADVKFIADKAAETGNDKIILTERGFCFGYNNLVFDPRSLYFMRKSGYPVVFDATHSVQMPSASGGTSGGLRELVIPYSRSAYAMGIDGLFLEVHEEPDKAPCDGPNMLDFKLFAELLLELESIGKDIYSRI